MIETLSSLVAYTGMTCILIAFVLETLRGVAVDLELAGPPADDGDD